MDKRKVLLVDDDVDFCLQIEPQLRAMGLEVLTAESHREANDLLAQHKVDLAIVDLMLEYPDSGFSLCYELKKADAAVPVIIVTGVASRMGIPFDTSTSEDRSWIKADVLLDKPIRFESLQQHIERLLVADVEPTPI